MTNNGYETVFYVWDVPGDITTSGVTDDEGSAIDHVAQALRSRAPSGAHGRIRAVRLAGDGSVRYVERRAPVKAWLDETSGAVVVVG